MLVDFIAELLNDDSVHVFFLLIDIHGLLHALHAISEILAIFFKFDDILPLALRLSLILKLIDLAGLWLRAVGRQGLGGRGELLK